MAKDDNKLAEENSRLKRELADLKEKHLPLVAQYAKSAGMPSAEENKAKRAALKKATKRTKDGKRHYRAGDEGAYVNGNLYREGELIVVPEDHEPSTTWLAVKANGRPLGEPDDAEVVEDKADALLAEVDEDEAPQGKKSKRASDEDVA